MPGLGIPVGAFPFPVPLSLQLQSASISSPSCPAAGGAPGCIPALSWVPRK